MRDTGKSAVILIDAWRGRRRPHEKNRKLWARPGAILATAIGVILRAMRRINAALCGLVAAATTLVAAQAVPPVVIPILAAPALASIQSRGGHGALEGNIRPLPYEVGLNPGMSSAEYHYRLKTDMTAPQVAEHYLPQLVGHGWKPAFRQFDSMLALARFSVGSETDPLIGTLTVVPFAATGQTLVSLRLARSRAPWRGTARPGGVRMSFGELTAPLLFPTAVTQAEPRGGGTSGEVRHYALRLQTRMSPAALLKDLESQLEHETWKVDARAGDSTQAIVRRSDVRGFSEVWMLTSMLDSGEIDAALTVIASGR
jgi:hypothetical protein